VTPCLVERHRRPDVEQVLEQLLSSTAVPCAPSSDIAVTVQ
jgi:hypothetical protein